MSGHITHHRGYAFDTRVRDPIEFPSSKYFSVIYNDNVIRRFRNICEYLLGHSVHRYQGTGNEHIHCATNSAGTAP